MNGFADAAAGEVRALTDVEDERFSEREAEVRGLDEFVEGGAVFKKVEVGARRGFSSKGALDDEAEHGGIPVGLDERQL